MSKETIEAAAADLGITMQAEFVPWSKSRNASEKHRSLNWRVSLLKNGKAFITTDYSAGVGHCPSYKQNDKTEEGSLLIAFECEHGKKGRFLASVDRVMSTEKPINPAFADVVHSLVSDSDVIDHPTYESWASDLGYDADSRKGEAIYRACLDIALKLRSAIGEEGLAKLREACQDY